MDSTVTPPPWTLGFDPGTQGAATLLDAAGVFAVWAWRDRQRGGLRCFELAVCTRDSEWATVVQMYPTIGAVGQAIAAQVVRATGRARIRVWIEGVYISRNPKTAIKLGVTSGCLIGPMLKFSDGRVIPDVQATKWRKEILGLPTRTEREKAKAASLKYMPLRHDGLQEVLESISEKLGAPITKLNHVTDSAGVAEYGWRYG